jgi:hypothetical protein
VKRKIYIKLKFYQRKKIEKKRPTLSPEGEYILKYLITFDGQDHPAQEDIGDPSAAGREAGAVKTFYKKSSFPIEKGPAKDKRSQRK